MQEIKVIIKDIPPSNNKYMGNSHSFQKYRVEKQKWELLVRAGIKNKPPVPIKKAIVKITYYFKDRRRHDPDNYSGKFLLDGLVKSGVLEDDSFNNIDLILKGDYDKNNPRTEIDIKEVG
ncbi:RusA family crossover junction endodeoxyribonuclease [Tepidibacter thalassicus]|uniref:Endodeoxyribonuclease RusA n=1 Tax=Tepidibacter thalassicus DSM 15285 TaxID=1123350 RepID=A0A1M5PWH2_9FIRM|nr:RusA family crossover junction endodeoxyribonuclease [Tepidibacter thalassicus]SHH06178.1 Endodeoxyribonuclease RusA [Tepidibacter thalassicus DSM 15285]